MKRNSAIENLRTAILDLEGKQSMQGLQLKLQFEQTYESLRPINIFKNVVKEATSSTFIIDNLLGTVTGFLSGYISKILIVGESHSRLRKILGMVAQFGITNLIAQHPDFLKSIFHSLAQRFFPEPVEQS